MPFARRLLAGTVALASLPAFAQTPPYVVPGKFSLTPPPGWVVVAPAPPQKATEAVAPQLGADAPARQPPLVRFVATTPTQGFASNLNLREVGDVIDADEPTLERLRAELSRGMGAWKPRIENAEVSVVGNRRVLRIEWSAKILEKPIRSVQVAYPGRAATFVATYMTHATAWAQELPAIEASIRSFRNLEPWWAWFAGRKILTSAIVGGLVLLVLALVARRGRRTRAA